MCVGSCGILLTHEGGQKFLSSFCRIWFALMPGEKTGLSQPFPPSTLLPCSCSLHRRSFPQNYDGQWDVRCANGVWAPGCCPALFLTKLSAVFSSCCTAVPWLCHSVGGWE